MNLLPKYLSSRAVILVSAVFAGFTLPVLPPDQMRAAIKARVPEYQRNRLVNGPRS